jgi:hypothetical protein
MNKEQIAFEKWVKARNDFESMDLDKYPNDCYKTHGIEWAWQGWQARAALDKQDSLEIVNGIDAAFAMMPKSYVDNLSELKEDDILYVFKFTLATVELLTKIRKHLTGE